MIMKTTTNNKALVEEIRSSYNEFIKDHDGKIPNLAYVKIQWEEDPKGIDKVETIVIDGYDETDGVPSTINDEKVLYYVFDIDRLCELTDTNDMTDFKIIEFVGFERAE